MSELRLSFDPGVDTGWCLWRDGKPVAVGTLKLGSHNLPWRERYAVLPMELHRLFMSITAEAPLVAVAIEETFAPKGGKRYRKTKDGRWKEYHVKPDSVRILSYFASGLELYWRVANVPVTIVEKLTTKVDAQTITAIITRADGTASPRNDHERDAVYVGVLAGFHNG